MEKTERDGDITLKTHIQGLDELFRGGLKPCISTTDDHVSNDKDKKLPSKGSMVIIKGEKGCMKIDLAMQLMNGLTKSIEEFRKEVVPPRLLSFNKRADNLIATYNLYHNKHGDNEERWENSKLETIFNSFSSNDEAGKPYDNFPFDNYLKTLEWMESQKREYSSGKKPFGVLVLEGFSQLRSEDLRSIPFPYLRSLARSISDVAIFVFDDREESNCDGDVVIETRKMYSSEEYMYMELQISKCVFQPYIIGWHQYKRRYDGIHVFTSLHYKLSMEGNSSSSAENIFNNDRWKEEFRDINEKSKVNDRNIFTDIFTSDSDDAMKTVTSLIGNSNTYKRYLALTTAYALALRGKHTLFFQFEKDQLLIMKDLICPCRANNKCDNYDSSGINACAECTRRFHFKNIKMGCKSAEEIFSDLMYMINKIRQESASGLHIIIDDLRMIEYSFPFLKETSLFVPALIRLCRSSKIKLTILCDKSSVYTQELCNLSDNIVVTERFNSPDGNGEGDYNIYIEKSIYSIRPSMIVKYRIKDIENLFSCNKDKNDFKIGIDSKDIDNIRSCHIGTMKDFWRQTYNIIDKGPRT